jgi:carboxymethylenebutenolidase
MADNRVSDEIIALYDEYTHAPLDRRVFLERLAKLAGSTAAAMALLPVLENNYARAAVVAPDDARLVTETVRFDVPGGSMAAYVAKPAEVAGALPAVIVIHENRGLNPHIQDVTRRMALAGYVAIAPDFLSADGEGTPDDEDAAREQIGALDADAVLANAVAAVAYARQGRDDLSGKVGTIGFCWGGGLVNRLAASEAKPEASVSFYGRQVPAEEARAITTPLLLHYAGLDERINAGIADFVAALEAAQVSFGMHLYEGVNHAFHNDTNAGRYDPEAAALAWRRTLDFLELHLRA